MQLMIEGSSLERDAIFWHYPHYANQGGRPAGSVRSGDWKLIKHFEDGRLELFNLRDDEGEIHDMSEAEPDVTRRLSVLLNDWQKAVEALIPKHNSNYRAAALEPGVDAADV